MTNTPQDKAQQALLMLRQSFLAELPERLQALEDLTLRLPEKEHFTPNYEELYRKTHSLKGSGGTYGLPIITTLCHELEEWLNSLDTSITAATLAPGLRLIDLLRQSLAIYRSGGEDFSEIESALRQTSRPPEAARKKIMLVDGTRYSRDICHAVLASLAVDVHTLNSGYLALGELLRHKYDILITSKELQDLNGLALISALRLSEGINKNIRIVLLTSQKNPSLCKEARPEAEITKGVDMDKVLQQTLNALLAQE